MFVPPLAVGTAGVTNEFFVKVRQNLRQQSDCAPAGVRGGCREGTRGQRQARVGAERLRAHAVPKVVAKAGELHTQTLLLSHVELRLSGANLADEDVGQVSYTDAVLEATVAGTRKHEIYATQLLEIAKTLELWSVKHFHAKWVQLQMPMHRVVEHDGH